MMQTLPEQLQPVVYKNSGTSTANAPNALPAGDHTTVVSQVTLH